MPSRLFMLLLLAAALSVLAVSCDVKEACSSETCAGCCDSDGACQSGFAADACGLSGNQCTPCGPSLVCVGGFCSAGGGGGGGTVDGGGGGGGGGGDAGSASVQGALGFPAVVARTSYHGLSDGGWATDYVSVTVADKNIDICRDFTLTEPLRALGLRVGMPNPGDGGVVIPGTYTVDNMGPTLPAGGVQALWATIQPDGGFDPFYGLSAGTITFTQVDTTRVRGSFSVQFALPDAGSSPLSGTFDAPACAP